MATRAPECPILRQAYEEPPSDLSPVDLSCGHIVSRLAVRRQLKEEGARDIACPICPLTTPVPEDGGADALPTNFVVVQGLKGEGGHGDGPDDGGAPACDWSSGTCGDGTAATRYCRDCAELLCVGCLAAHSRGRGTRAHSVVSVEEMPRVRSGARISGATDACSRHPGEALRLWCDTCGVRVCRDCVVRDHALPEHDFDFSALKFSEHRPGMDAAVSMVEARMLEVERAIADLERMEGEIAERDRAVREVISERFESLAVAIRDRRAELLELCSIKARRKREGMVGQREALTKSLEEMRAGCGFARRTLAHGDATPDLALLVRRQLLQELGRMQCRELALRPGESTHLEFVDGDQANIAEFGDINDHKINPANCTAVGDGLINARVGVEATFMVRAFDFDGKSRAYDGVCVKAELVCSGDVEDATLAAIIVDNHDGTYSCRYTPHEGHKGMSQLHTTIHGEAICGSPFVLEVHHSVPMPFLTSVVGRCVQIGDGGRRFAYFCDSGGVWEGAYCDKPIADGSGVYVSYIRLSQYGHGNNSWKVLVGVKGGIPEKEPYRSTYGLNFGQNCVGISGDPSFEKNVFNRAIQQGDLLGITYDSLQRIISFNCNGSAWSKPFPTPSSPYFVIAASDAMVLTIES